MEIPMFYWISGGNCSILCVTQLCSNDSNGSSGNTFSHFLYFALIVAFQNEK
jgi:hypothetical protein